ncbi:MAG: CBS domain-containing protein [Pseudomonadota bacterium]
MTVKRILDQKPQQGVETISGQETLGDAAAMLAAKKIGALIVGDGGHGVAGILSERDIVNRIAAEGAAALSKPVSTAMTRTVVVAALHETAVSVLQRMTEGRFRHMPVMEEGRLIGVISIGDVVKARITEVEQENRAMEDMIKGF